jgi:hypothetical protein
MTTIEELADQVMQVLMSPSESMTGLRMSINADLHEAALRAAGVTEERLSVMSEYDTEPVESQLYWRSLSMITAQVLAMVIVKLSYEPSLQRYRGAK